MASKTLIKYGVSLSIMMMAGAAAAQDAPGAVQEVVVTGSRVISNGNNSPTPVTVALAEQLLTAQPAGIIQGLNTLPGLLGSINAASNVNSGGFNTLNLRGVGSTRALVLYDGRRLGPTQGGTGSTAGAVDVDIIPQMLLKRVDVVTGGASAVYGSDAVSGVVNFITDTHFNGLKANISAGVSTYGDDQKLNLGIAAGHELFGGKGHLEGSFEVMEDPGVTNRNSRPFLRDNATEQGSVVGSTAAPGSASNPYVLDKNATINTASFGGLINSGANGPLAGLNFAQNGALSPFVRGAPTGTSGADIGGQGATYTGSSLVAAQKNSRVFLRFDYDFSDKIHGYAQVAGSQFTDEYVGQNVLLSKIAIGYNNPFLSSIQSQYQSAIAGLSNSKTPTFQLSKMDTEIPDYHFITNEYYYMVAAGLDGSIGKLGWSIDYDHTDSEQHLTNANNVNLGRLYASLNAVTNPANGQTVCNAALANPGSYGSCVPLNVFGPSSESASAVAYIEQATHSAQIYKGDDVSATFKGAPFDLPAGPVNMALSGEYRTLSLRVASDASPLTTVNCNGIQYNCVSTTTQNITSLVTPANTVSLNVGEVAYETDIPIVANLPFAQAFNINGAVRYTNYNTSGSVWTWKVGGDWKVNDEFTVRATRSRDIRAPGLTDLFASSVYTLKNYTDFLTGASNNIFDVTQGNPNLKPETADTTTAGIVWRPKFVSGLSFSVDAYHILITNAIVSIDGFNASTGAVCKNSGFTDPTCALFQRPFPYTNTTPANFPTQLFGEELNVASLETYGVDFEANYTTRVFDRRLSLRGLANWQPHLVYNNGPGGTVDVGGAADGVGGLPPIPAIKLVMSGNYDISDKWSVFAEERWRGALRQNGTAGLFFNQSALRPIGYTDVTVSYVVSKQLSAFLNIQNLFNAYPPAWASSGGSIQPGYLGGFAQADDIEGRFFTVGLKLKL